MTKAEMQSQIDTLTSRVRAAEARVAELEDWAQKVLNETPAIALPGDLDLDIIDPINCRRDGGEV